MQRISTIFVVSLHLIHIFSFPCRSCSVSVLLLFSSTYKRWYCRTRLIFLSFSSALSSSIIRRRNIRASSTITSIERESAAKGDIEVYCTPPWSGDEPLWLLRTEQISSDRKNNSIKQRPRRRACQKQRNRTIDRLLLFINHRDTYQDRFALDDHYP